MVRPTTIHNLFILFAFLLVAIWQNPALCQERPESPKSFHISYYSRDINNTLRFVLVEKDTQRLTLYEYGEVLVPLQVFECATGENPGIKLADGDARTPVGIYFITEMFRDSKVTVFGDRAYHLDYPNIFDQQDGRRGDGIFLHGTDKALTSYSTNGCISMENSALERLAPYLALNKVPVIIVEHLEEPLQVGAPMLQPEDEQFSEILDKLSFTTGTVETERIHTLLYISQGNRGVASIEYDTLDGEFFQYRFQRKVYLTPGASRSWRIVKADENQIPGQILLAKQPEKLHLPLVNDEPDAVVASTSLPKPVATPPVETVLPVVSKPSVNRGERLLGFIEAWRTAWTQKDIDHYMGCYSTDFFSGGLNKSQWERKKRRLNRTYKYIDVRLADIVIEWIETGAKVTFYQDYESDRYRSSGTKTLILREINNQWQIEKEFM